MVDSSDAIGLAETGIGIGASLLFTGMMLNYTKDMTDKLIEQGKKQGPRGSRKRKSKSKSKKQTPFNPFSAKNLNKRVRY